MIGLRTEYPRQGPLLVFGGECDGTPCLVQALAPQFVAACDAQALRRFVDLASAGGALAADLVAGVPMRAFALPQCTLHELLGRVDPAQVTALLISLWQQRGAQVHGWIEPQSIWLDLEGAPRLLPAGLRVLLAGFFGAASSRPKPLFQVAPQLLNYLGPTAIDGVDPTERDDLYSLAALGFALVTGAAPFARENLMTSASAIKNGTLDVDLEAAYDIEPTLAQFIRRGLARAQFPDLTIAALGDGSQAMAALPLPKDPLAPVEQFVDEIALDALLAERMKAGPRLSAPVAEAQREQEMKLVDVRLALMRGSSDPPREKRNQMLLAVLLLVAAAIAFLLPMVIKSGGGGDAQFTPGPRRQPPQLTPQEIEILRERTRQAEARQAERRRKAGQLKPPPVVRPREKRVPPPPQSRNSRVRSLPAKKTCR